MFYKKNIGERFDSRSRLEVFEETIKNDPNIGIAVYPTDYLKYMEDSLFPLSAIANTRTILCNESGEYAYYESDRYGFNNPDNEWNAKEIEYLLVGDSFTHGACVDRPNDIGSVLRTLTNKNVLNLGYGGNGPLLEYAVLREYLDIKPVKKFYGYILKETI